MAGAWRMYGSINSQMQADCAITELPLLGPFGWSFYAVGGQIQLGHRHRDGLFRGMKSSPRRRRRVATKQILAGARDNDMYALISDAQMLIDQPAGSTQSRHRRGRHVGIRAVESLFSTAISE